MSDLYASLRDLRAWVKDGGDPLRMAARAALGCIALAFLVPFAISGLVAGWILRDGY